MLFHISRLNVQLILHSRLLTFNLENSLHSAASAGGGQQTRLCRLRVTPRNELYNNFMNYCIRTKRNAGML